MINQKKNKSNNLQILFSIVVAFLLWLYVIGDQNPRVTQIYNDIEVQLLNRDVLESRDLILSGADTYTIKVKVLGRTNTLFNLKSVDIIASIDLVDITSKGTYDLKVNIEGLPEDVELVSSNPEIIPINVDKLTTQERRVDVEVRGRPADGMADLNYLINTQKVTLSGPEDILDRVDKVMASIDINDAENDVVAQVDLTPIDEKGEVVNGIHINPSVVQVTVPIGNTKSVLVETNIVGNVKNGYVITEVIITPTNKTIAGKTSILNKVRALVTKEISVEGIDSTFERNVNLVIPDDIKIISGESSIDVKIIVEPIVKKEFTLKNISIINVGEGLELDGNTSSVDVTVTLSGVQSIMEKIRDNSIDAYLDLTGLNAGTHEVSVKVDKIEGVAIDNINPNKVTLTINELS